MRFEIEVSVDVIESCIDAANVGGSYFLAEYGQVLAVSTWDPWTQVLAAVKAATSRWESEGGGAVSPTEPSVKGGYEIRFGSGRSVLTVRKSTFRGDHFVIGVEYPDDVPEDERGRVLALEAWTAETPSCYHCVM